MLWSRWEKATGQVSPSGGFGSPVCHLGIMVPPHSQEWESSMPWIITEQQAQVVSGRVGEVHVSSLGDCHKARGSTVFGKFSEKAGL